MPAVVPVFGNPIALKPAVAFLAAENLPMQGQHLDSFRNAAAFAFPFGLHLPLLSRLPRLCGLFLSRGWRAVLPA